MLRGDAGKGARRGRGIKGKGEKVKLDKAITEANAVDVAKKILFSLDSRLRSQELFLYCSQDFVDMYNESYLLTHSAIPYNTKYNQPTVEGSNGKLTFCPLWNKSDSKFMHASQVAKQPQIKNLKIKLTNLKIFSIYLL